MKFFWDSIVLDLVSFDFDRLVDEVSIVTRRRIVLFLVFDIRQIKLN